MVQTNFTPESINSTSFTPVEDVTTSRTAALATPIGLLLTLTHAAASTVTFGQYDTDFTPESVVSTGWTPEVDS